MNADLLLTRGDSPNIIIIATSTAGTLLFVLNLALVLCYVIRRRKKKCMEEGQLFGRTFFPFPLHPVSLTASADRDELAYACFVFVLAHFGVQVCQKSVGEMSRCFK